jgi:hypothetical protein
MATVGSRPDTPVYPPPSLPADVPAVPGDGRPERRRVDWFEWLVLIAFAAVSVWVLAVNLSDAPAHGLVWTGIDGEFPGDQMGYLAWIQDSARHVLVSDLYVPWPTPHDYLQPMIVVSGLLVRLGMVPWLALLLWKPVTVLAIFFAVRAYCRRSLTGRWERRAALALALFGSSIGTLGDEWLPAISWGYVFALAAVAALVGAFLYYDRARSSGRIHWLAPGLALLASWLNPWEGEILVLVVAGVELAWLRESLTAGVKRRLALPAVTLLAAALPLAYYAALDQFDPAWSSGHAVVSANWPLSIVLQPIVPLLVAAAFAYLRKPKGFLDTATLAWPLATFVAWALNQTPVGAWSLHSWTGITIPLGVLAVKGVSPIVSARRFDRADRLLNPAWLAAAAVGLLTIPPTVGMMSGVQVHIAPQARQPNLITHPLDRALRFLASDRQPGSVLTDYRDGVDVPGETGRRTYASALLYWSEPGALYRADAAERLLRGAPWWWGPPLSWYPRGSPRRLDWITGTAALRFVQRSGARFVLEHCGGHAKLGLWLRDRLPGLLKARRPGGPIIAAWPPPAP